LLWQRHSGKADKKPEFVTTLFAADITFAVLVILSGGFIVVCFTYFIEEIQRVAEAVP